MYTVRARRGTTLLARPPAAGSTTSKPQQLLGYKVYGSGLSRQMGACQAAIALRYGQHNQRVPRSPIGRYVTLFKAAC